MGSQESEARLGSDDQRRCWKMKTRWASWISMWILAAASAAQVIVPPSDQEMLGPGPAGSRYGLRIVGDGELSYTVGLLGTDRIGLWDEAHDTWDLVESGLPSSTFAAAHDRRLAIWALLDFVDVVEVDAQGTYAVIDLVQIPPPALGLRAVALEGDFLAVSGQTGAGVGYTHIYRWSGIEYVLEATLSQAAPNHEYGAALAFDSGGSILSVGIPNADGASETGRVQRWARVSNGAWLFLDSFEAPSPLVGNRFGSALASGHGVLAVGAPGHSHSFPIEVAAGAVFLFDINDLVVKHAATVVGDEGGDRLGTSVDLGDESVLLAGAPGVDIELPPSISLTDVGQARAYRRVGQFWRHFATLGPTLQDGGQAGTEVALIGESALVGVPWFDAGGVVDRGAVYSFVGLDRIFGDGFESGDLAGWSMSQP